jgi:hypothetical protein
MVVGGVEQFAKINHSHDLTIVISHDMTCHDDDGDE